MHTNTCFDFNTEIIVKTVTMIVIAVAHPVSQVVVLVS